MPDLLAYPSLRQMADFVARRKANLTSLFRAKSCDVCGKEVPREFQCCSIECHEKLPKGRTMIWNLNLDSLLSGQHRVITKEGAVRKGQITKINWAQTTIDKQVVSWPHSVEFNNEASDFIDWDIIERIERI